MSVSSKSVSKQQDIILSPDMFLPPGVVDMRYSTDEPILVESEEEAPLEGEFIEGIGEDLTGAETLLPPEMVTVVSTSARQAPDGRTVIDVVIEVEDVPGITQYDIRVAKS